MNWLNENFPKLQTVDVDNTMLRYDFPPEVCEWIKTSWTKTSDEKGGVYQKPNDQLNQTAMHIMKTEGLDKAAKHMMESSGMDYGRMRMDYG
jgi:hypothetical protein